jgi:pimeloyl-ACP methyl ester carboxylesterase
MTNLSAAPIDYEKIVFKNRETLRLAAYYHAPEKNNPVFILLHGLASSKEEWLSFGQHLNRQGWGWFAFDARGHGDSSLTRGADGGANGYKYFGAPGRGSDWERMIDDVGAAV